MDFSNSVVMPSEDFHEMSEAAYSSPKPSLGDRAATTAQTTLFFAALAAGVTGACFGWAKAVDYVEERKFQRRIRNVEAAAKPLLVK